MQNAEWQAQNEATDEDGFFLDGAAFLEAEREELRTMGAPDVDAIVFGEYEVVDRDEAWITASVSPAFHQWLVDNDMLHD